MQIIEIWQISLQKYFGTRGLKKYEKKMVKIMLKVSESSDIKIDETIVRLGDCFKYISQNMFRI